MVTQSPSDGKYQWLDAFRFVAAYLVVLSHSNGLLVDVSTLHGIGHKALNFVSNLGVEAVIFFFLLSGFWICRSVLRAGAGFSWADYASARLGRLWVVLIPALISTWLWDSIGIHVFPGGLYEGIQGTSILNYSIDARLTAPLFVCNALFLQNIACETLGSNGPLWSLAFEFWFYAAFPALWLTYRFRPYSFILFAVAIVAWANPGLVTGFAAWLLGGLLQWADARNLLPQTKARQLLLPSAAAALISIPFLHLINHNWHVQVLALSIAFAQFLFVFLAADLPYPVRLRVLARYGSTSSFSLYATHFPFLLFLSGFFAKNELLPVSAKTWLLVFLLTLPTLAYGWLFSMATERKTNAAKSVLRRTLQKFA